MLSRIKKQDPYLYFARMLACLAVASSVVATSVSAQRLDGITRSSAVVCSVSGFLVVANSSERCDPVDGLYENPSGFLAANAAFNNTPAGSTTFTGGTVSFNSVTTAFGGGSTTFNNVVHFTGASATFSTPTSVTELTAITSLGAAAGATVNFSGNIVHGVGTGVAATDAVNVGQLNAATSGVAANITALQSTTATHTTQITNLQTGLATTNATVASQGTQIATLQAADAMLDTRVGALEGITANLDSRFNDVADRSDSGTAAAVALSGAMFLPGKTFNLTGNVASYRGAHAGALQFGALVSDNAAVNAGIAHGFNKGGKTAMRAGFTLGW